MIPKPAHPSSPNPFSLPQSASLPPISFREAQSTQPSTVRSGDQRLSDRTTSQLNKDDKSSQVVKKDSPRTHFQPFPSSIPVPTAVRPLLSGRSKTLSDPPRMDSPLMARYGRGTRPSSTNDWQGSVFARPSPASRLRKGSIGAMSDTNEPSDRSPPFPGMRPITGRSVSASPIQSISPPWAPAIAGQLSMPISPTYDLVHTSFHHRATSPDGMEQVLNTDEHIGRPELLSFEIESFLDEDSYLGDGISKNHTFSDARFSRISVCHLFKKRKILKILPQTGSTTSLQTSHDQLQALQKQNDDLARRLRESEKQSSNLRFVVVSREQHESSEQ